MEESSKPLNDQKHENMEVLFEQDKLMAPGMFKVSIAHSDSHFFITANRISGGEDYVIELPVDQIEQITAEFNGDYRKMSEYLEILNRQLVLLNPKSKDVSKKGKKKRKRRGRRGRSSKRGNDDELASDDEIDENLVNEIDNLEDSSKQDLNGPIEESKEENKD